MHNIKVPLNSSCHIGIEPVKKVRMINKEDLVEMIEALGGSYMATKLKEDQLIKACLGLSSGITKL
ncbi:MAG TPA: hypothetical protein VI387_13470, partial [Candidatus Brocadiales bacterium]|nr:hypothetical protein [Candidatus Brocadiales bacterium]